MNREMKDAHCAFEWHMHLGALDVDAAKLVSSVRVQVEGPLASIRVWNRGALAGKLVVQATDWPMFVSLLGFDPQEGVAV